MASTIDSRQIVREIIMNNGFYQGDPQVQRVYSYVNAWGKKTWHVHWHDTPLLESEYVKQPTLLWERLTGITQAGKAFLNGD